MALVAKSSTIGSSPGRGMPTVNGLVRKRACVPPHGATIGGLLIALVKCTEARPAAIACSAQWPTRPRWCALRRPITHTPSRRARSIAICIAWCVTDCPMPRRPSIVSSAPLSWAICTVWFSISSPLCSALT